MTMPGARIRTRMTQTTPLIGNPCRPHRDGRLVAPASGQEDLSRKFFVCHGVWI